MRFSWFAISLVISALVSTATPANATTTAAGSFRPATFGPGAMVSEWNGKCLDENVNVGIYNGAPVQLWDCNGSAQQTWIYEDDWTIRNQWSGLCLDADKSTAAHNGSLVQMWQCIPGENNVNNGNQAWIWRGTGQDNLVNPWGSANNNGRGRCLDADIAHGSFNGQALQVWDCNGQSNQAWRLP